MNELQAYHDHDARVRESMKEDIAAADSLCCEILLSNQSILQLK